MLLVRKLLTFVVVVIFTMLVFMGTIQIFSRFLNFSAPWATEVATFLFIWLVFISGYFTILKGLNITFDLIQDLLPGKTWKIVFTFSNVVSCGFLILLTFLGINLITIIGSSSPVLKIPMNIVYLAIPIGSFVMLIAQIYTYFILIKKRNDYEC